MNASTSDGTDIDALRRQLARQEERLRAIEDRHAIIDCTHRFSRGVNRRDRELLKSAFHPDAIDDHGFFVGGREDLVKWIDEVYQGVSATQHFVTNHRVEIEGDTAHGETYWFVANVGLDGIGVILRGGRYIDRFERRDGHWAIAARVCLIEWNGAPGEVRFPPDALAELAKSGASTHDRNDLSYVRPLTVRRKPTAG